MNKKVFLTLGLITIILSSFALAACDKYVIDGSMTDWGVDINQDWSQNATWLPNSGVSFIVEDNNDPIYGTSNPGVHIRGYGSSYSTYVEPKIQLNNGFWVIEPYGSEQYDLEGMYFDQDDECIYVAIISGLAEDNLGDSAPGDLGLNLDRDINTGLFGYEYGIKLGTKTGLNQWDLCYMPNWSTGIYTTLKPTTFKDGQCSDVVDGAYVNSGRTDNGYTNYIIEVAIPKDKVGNPYNPTLYNLYVSENCGNEHIPAPEVLTILAAVMLISPAFAYLVLKKRKV